MEVALQSHIVSRKTSNNIIRDSRHFALEGMDENVWVLFEGDEIGEELFDELCEHVFAHVFEKEETQSLAAIERFENAMKSINEKLSTQAAIPPEFLKKNSFVILLTVDNELHFTVLGSAEVYFIRGGKVFHASEGIGAENVNDDLFMNIASGESQDGDVLFLSTTRLLRYVSNAQLLDISKNSAQEAAQTIEEFINIDEGGVFGVLKAEGAPALPFESAAVSRGISAQGKKSKFSFHDIALPPVLAQWAEKLPVQSNKKEFLFLGIGFVALMLLWSVVSLLSGGISGDATAVKKQITEVESLIGVAESYRAENNTPLALEQLTLAEEKASAILAGDSPFRADAQGIITKIQTMRDDLSGTFRISGGSLVNIGAEKEGVDLSGLFFYDDEIFSYDGKTLFRIIGNKVESMLDLKEGEEVIAGVPLEQKNQKVFLTKSGKIIESDGNSVSFAKTEDPASWKSAVDIGFFNKNIYLLSPDNNDIYKYVRKTDGYSSPVSYNADASFEDALSIAIDGSIFVLKKEGKVIKMHAGKTTEFEMVDVPAGFEAVDKIYTLSDLDLLIFMASDEKRIYIFRKGEKGAKFDRQIVLDIDAPRLSGLWFDLSANRILVSGKSRIYEVPLTQ